MAAALRNDQDVFAYSEKRVPGYIYGLVLLLLFRSHANIGRFCPPQLSVCYEITRMNQNKGCMAVLECHHWLLWPSGLSPNHVLHPYAESEYREC
jgi:hypothetical protein